MRLPSMNLNKLSFMTVNSLTGRKSWTGLTDEQAGKDRQIHNNTEQTVSSSLEIPHHY
jgi:hypothetical protein